MVEALVVDDSRCTGCRLCEMICSLFRTNGVRPSDARCRIIRKGDLSIVAVFCRHCDDAPCMDACVVEAIKRDSGTGAVIIDIDECVDCGECIEACPYNAICTDHDGHVVKCDLCGGDPQCVLFCRSEAVTVNPEHPVIETSSGNKTAGSGGA